MAKPMFVVVIVLLTTAALLLTQPMTTGAATTYASDSFSRTLTDTWGSPYIGGKYTLGGTAADFGTNGSAGTIRVPTANWNRYAHLTQVSARDVEVRFRIKRDKVAAGGSQIVYFLARRVSPGYSYQGRIRYGTDGTVRLQAVKEVAGAQTVIGGEKTATGLTAAAGTFIRVRGQVTGVNPTTILLKAWLDGQTEPSSWTYTGIDYASSLQVAGSVGLRTYLAGTVTNAPVVFTFDDYVVTDAPPAPPTPTPTFTKTLTPTPTRTSTPKPTPTGPSVYWGALVHGQAPSNTNMAPGGVFDTFEQHAKKKMSIIHWGQAWKMNGTYQAFYAPWFTNVRNHGSIPLIDWSSQLLGGGATQSEFALAKIYNGYHDGYIKNWALAAKAWGHPFFLRFDWEMNGNWDFPWSEQLNGNQPGDYVKAWRHVHDIFTQNGVQNVTWVWCPNVSGTTTRAMAGLYPGDAYVDWTCLDGYNMYSTWLNFNQVFNGVGINWLYASYNEILNVAPTKPLMVGEFASLEAGDGGTKKAAWIRDAISIQVPAYFPRIKAILWFNWNARNSAYTFPIESSTAATSAFAAAISSSIYPANAYSNLNTSPIPPLP
jgi:beta-mannanase